MTRPSPSIEVTLQGGVAGIPVRRSPSDSKSDTPTRTPPGAVRRANYPRPVGSTRVQLVALEPPEEVLESSAGAPIPFPALELPPARKPGWPTLAALAVACGVVAIALGAWALVADTRSSSEPASAATDDRSLAVLTDRGAERYPLRGSLGRITLVVAPRGDAVLALDGLGDAPPGSAYAAWVVRAGSAVPLPAGTFDARERAVPLTRRVPPGSRVGVTLERTRAPERPSRTLRLVAVRSGR